VRRSGGADTRTQVTHSDETSSASRQRWVGHLAALFFTGGGALALVTLPFAPPDANVRAMIVLSLIACGTGAVVLVVHWERLPQRATLVLVPPAFALIALGNAYGGAPHFTYGAFFVMAFAWIGLAHPPWTCALLSPLALLAYIVPLGAAHSTDVATGVGSALLVIPLSVLVGESIAQGLDRLARMQAELQRERAAAEDLRALDALRETFMRAASHELRTPLTVCRGHLDVLANRPDPDELRQTIDLVTDELTRMGRLVDDMTTLTRLEDPSALRLERIDVGDLVEGIASKAEPLLEGRLRLRPAPRGELRADRQRLTQALLNMLNNAAVHGGEHARVELRAIGERNAWRFEVADDGRGLGSRDVDAIFDPFRHHPQSPGTGLGLAIVRAIARAHGGAAGAEHNEKAGAVFWIRIPA
jgi:signal transduction histidine kinase